MKIAKRRVKKNCRWFVTFLGERQSKALFFVKFTQKQLLIAAVCFLTNSQSLLFHASRIRELRRIVVLTSDDTWHVEVPSSDFIDSLIGQSKSIILLDPGAVDGRYGGDARAVPNPNKSFCALIKG